MTAVHIIEGNLRTARRFVSKRPPYIDAVTWRLARAAVRWPGWADRLRRRGETIVTRSGWDWHGAGSEVARRRVADRTRFEIGNELADLVEAVLTGRQELDAAAQDRFSALASSILAFDEIETQVSGE